MPFARLSDRLDAPNAQIVSERPPLIEQPFRLQRHLKSPFAIFASFSWSCLSRPEKIFTEDSEGSKDQFWFERKPLR
jgi:hypothetical protein